MKQEDVRALVLAGGLGTRLRPLTETTPKVLLPIQGKPIICRLLDQLHSLNINKVTISVRYLKQQVMDLLGDRYDYVEGGSTMAESVFLTAQSMSERVLVGFSGDTLLTCRSIRELLQCHDPDRCDATLLLTKLAEPQQKKWNFVIDDGRLTDLTVGTTYTNSERVGLALNRSAISTITSAFTAYMDSGPTGYAGYELFQTGWNFIMKRMLDSGLRVQAIRTDHPVYNINDLGSYQSAGEFVTQHEAD